MIGSFKVPTIFSAVDKISPTLDKVNSKVAKVQKTMNKMANYAVVGGFAIATALGFAFNEAVKFEDKMADVAKVMNLDAGSKELKKVSDEVKTLSLHLAKPPEQVAELYGNIAQAGVAAKDVYSVSKLAGEMGVAFGIGAGEAGEAFVKLQNSMGLTLDATKQVTDALNHLGNNTAAKSSELLEFMSSGGSGAGRAMDMLGQQAAAVGSVFISSGKSASEAGTIFERLMKGIMKSDDLRNVFNRSGKGLEGLFAVLEKGMKLNPEKQFKYFQQFGEYGTDIMLLANNMDLLRKNTALVADENAFANSSFLEFENRQKTTATQIQNLKNQMTLLAITVGDELIPMFSNLLKEYTPILEKTAKWIADNSDLIPVLVGVAGALIAFKGVMIVVNALMVIGQGVMAAYTAIMGAYNGMALVAAVGGYTFAGAVWAALWPILLVIAAVVAIIAIFYYWDEICEWFGKQWDKFTSWIGELWDKLVKWFQEFSFVNFFKQIGNSIIDFMLFPIRQVLELVAKIPGKIGRMAQEALDLTHSLKFEIEETVAPEMSPSATAQVATSESITTNNSNIQLDINDRNNTLGGIQQFGIPIPINVNGTKFGQ